MQIDWSQMVTREMKEQQQTQVLAAKVTQQIQSLRQVADSAIAPLQDAVELEEATEAEAAALKDWKRYRIALNRLLEQPGYPELIDWPAQPA
ncbi:tail fiber assembly protein [Pseudomonas sp. PAGU 2196]|uniref:tail fiber assembly protein n=1 Tax=Pseudomonas sp. PAGU 2196 TaxID=2793997 RepID=UPI001EDF39ED|nr:tail fiber assembly protein [Pseudomonas sp. PAGU 2196]GHS80349.1 tail fiber assembly protein [Pseudomonas sp. PAGU 2196]